MSGGSWDYIYFKFDEVSSRLCASSDPLRSALGVKVAHIAKALHDIEWVDSSDYAEGDDVAAIKKALGIGESPEQIVAEEAISKIKIAIADAEKAIQVLNGATNA